jgi:mannose-1-phosphate guanylyltransferase
MASGMILAAGLGTRLRPLTDELPKPLVPLGDAPLLVRVARRLATAGIAPLAFNTHHLAAAFDQRATDPRSRSVDVAALAGLVALHEETILGTAGGVANARAVLGSDEVVVWNGDLEADVDLARLLAAHRSSSRIVTLVVAPREVGEGTLGLDASGDVVRLRGERFGEEVSGGDFLGAHVIGPALVAELPAVGCLVGDVYLLALRRGEKVGSFRHDGPWDDVGSLRAYLAANLRWLGDRNSFRGDGARVEAGILLDQCVIGAQAEVRGQGSLRDVVVWPGAVAFAPLASAIVTPRGIVAVL